MQQLNLPEVNLKIMNENNKLKVFDIIRKKYVALTPEEQVRQQFIHYLINEKHYPKGLLAVEKQLKVYDTEKRADIVLYNTNLKPIVIVECKAPEVTVNQKAFDQIARYNLSLKVDYLIVTNGLEHFACQLDFNTNSYRFLEEIPNYKEIF